MVLATVDQVLPILNLLSPCVWVYGLSDQRPAGASEVCFGTLF